MSQQNDSTLVGVKRYSHVGEDKNGRDVQMIAFSPEEVGQLVEALAPYADAGVGAVLRLATEDRERKDGSGTFKSAFILVFEDKPKQEKKKTTFVDKKTTGTVSKFAPKTTTGNGSYNGKSYRKQQTTLTED